MFYKILVAVDTSKVNKHVFSRSVELAKLMGAQLNVLHVLKFASIQKGIQESRLRM
jgi:nucleotide-binding universal stress UspA family protein